MAILPITNKIITMQEHLQRIIYLPYPSLYRRSPIIRSVIFSCSSSMLNYQYLLKWRGERGEGVDPHIWGWRRWIMSNYFKLFGIKDRISNLLEQPQSLKCDLGWLYRFIFSLPYSNKYGFGWLSGYQAAATIFYESLVGTRVLGYWVPHNLKNDLLIVASPMCKYKSSTNYHEKYS